MKPREFIHGLALIFRPGGPHEGSRWEARVSGRTHRIAITPNPAPRQGRMNPMPSTHTSLHYHLVWSTKDRRNLIETAWRPRLHQWLGGCIKALEGAPLAIGGVSDHVHCLVGLKATHCLADFMRVLKSESSEWVHTELRLRGFQWQEGYGAFTVSPGMRKKVESYVRNQEPHHAKKTFQQEYVELLEQAGIEYEAKYLW